MSAHRGIEHPNGWPPSVLYASPGDDRLTVLLHLPPAQHLEPVVTVRMDFVSLVGSDAGMLLSHLHYWFTPDSKGKSRLRVRRGDRLMYVRTNADMRKSTGLTEWKLKKAHRHLVQMGLLQTEIHKVGADTAVHWWLDTARVGVLLKSGLEATSNPGWRPHPTPVIRLERRLEEKRNSAASQRDWVNDKWHRKTDEESRATDCKTDEADFELDITVVLEDEMAVKFVAPTGAQVGVVDALKKVGGMPPSVYAEKMSASAFAALWKRQQSRSTGKFQKQWTGKELAQASRLVKMLGAQAWPVTEWALANWGPLAFEVKSVKGTGSSPMEPHIGWLLQYHDVAVRMFEQSVCQKPVAIPVQTLQLIAEPGPGAPGSHVGVVETPEIPASMDEVAAILAGMKKK